MVDGVGNSEEVFSRPLAGLWPRIPADRIAQLAGVSEPVPTGPPVADREDLSANAIDVVIEVPRGSRNKHEFDHERHVLHLDRRLFSATVYPADYGFVPETLAEDADPLDALVLLEEAVFPGVREPAGPVGAQSRATRARSAGPRTAAARRNLVAIAIPAWQRPP